MLQGPRIWYKTVREIVTLERMHRAFDDGLMEVRGRGRGGGSARVVQGPWRRKKHRMKGAGPAGSMCSASDTAAVALQ